MPDIFETIRTNQIMNVQLEYRLSLLNIWFVTLACTMAMIWQTNSVSNDEQLTRC